MFRIVTVIGARPQFVKAAVLSRAIRSGRRAKEISEYLVHTGQHYDQNMSEIFFEEMGIPKPDLNLGVGSGSHGRMTGEMLMRIEDVLLEQKPDLLLVYGDTDSTLAGALAASKLLVPVAHVEAGLRSFEMAMPEEQNRRLTDHLSSYLFCPTDAALRNLASEGIVDSGQRRPSPDRKSVANVGDIMLEASRLYRALAQGRPEGRRASRLGLPDRFYLLTIHRAENTDDPTRLRAIVEALNARSDLEAVFPLHPRTRKIMEQEGIELGVHIRVIEPVGYLDMLELESACEFVVTDSGGVQKEAYFFEKPCITLRDSTEWVELVESGWNTLVGADASAIGRAVEGIGKPSGVSELYGSGDCSSRIIERLLA